MDFLTLAKERYSVRKFSPKKVESEKINRILEAGRLAPTAKNMQPQRFFVLTSSEALEKIDLCTASHFAPPVVIVVCCDESSAWVRDNDGKNHGDIDAALAVSQMMLEACEEGLGTTYVGMFDIKKIKEQFPQMENLTPVAVLPLGYPADDAHPSRLHNDRKPLEEITSYL